MFAEYAGISFPLDDHPDLLFGHRKLMLIS